MAPRALVIEDMPNVQRLVEVCLRAAGMDVVTRGDGLSGVAEATANPPDLVVLDIGLPRLDGWGVLERLRANPETARVPVLVLTAHGSDENRDRAERDGADFFMPKPFAPRDLRRVALELLTGSPSYRRPPADHPV